MYSTTIFALSKFRIDRDAIKVSPNNAADFAAKNNPFSRDKNNGATTTILYQRRSVVAGRVMGARPIPQGSAIKTLQ